MWKKIKQSMTEFRMAENWRMAGDYEKAKEFEKSAWIGIKLAFFPFLRRKNNEKNT